MLCRARVKVRARLRFKQVERSHSEARWLCHGGTWGYMGVHGCSWGYMGLHGVIWGHTYEYPSEWGLEKRFLLFKPGRGYENG